MFFVIMIFLEIGIHLEYLNFVYWIIDSSLQIIDNLKEIPASREGLQHNNSLKN